MARLYRAGRVCWWLVAVLALLALSVPPAVWFLCFRATPTATALLQVSMRQDTYLSNPPPSDSSGIQKEFEMLQEYAARMDHEPLRFGDCVAEAGDQQFGDRPAQEAQRDRLDPRSSGCLVSRRRGSHAGRPHRRRSSGSGDPPGAVVDAYLSEIVDSERAERNHKYSAVCQVYREKEEEMRRKSAALFMLAAELGTPDAETLSLQQKLRPRRDECKPAGVARSPLVRVAAEERTGGPTGNAQGRRKHRRR